jgi:trimethylamine:corrinoid methyltransferase-like protein
MRARSRGGRQARLRQHATETTPRLSTINYGIKPVEMVSADELESIHQASLLILKEIGIDFRDAFILPEILDYQSFEQWRAAGSKDMPQRANEKARQLLSEYQGPPLDPAIHEALDAYVTTRQEQISPNLS